MSNSATLNTISAAWKARAGAPAHHLLQLTDSAALTLTASGNGTNKVFTVSHDLGVVPEVVVMEPQNPTSSATHTVTASSTLVTVTFATAPASGSSNVSFVGIVAR